jgi:hypothetical protein
LQRSSPASLGYIDLARYAAISGLTLARFAAIISPLT